MLSNETVRKLHEMRLSVMAETFSAQLEDVQFRPVAFEDRFDMLVDVEWSARKSNRLLASSVMLVTLTLPHVSRACRRSWNLRCFSLASFKIFLWRFTTESGWYISPVRGEGNM